MDERPPKFQLIDIKLDGGLEALIASRRHEGLSFDKIARLIWSRTGISVTGSTIANWCTEMDIHSPTEVAS